MMKPDPTKSLSPDRRLAPFGNIFLTDMLTTLGTTRATRSPKPSPISCAFTCIVGKPAMHSQPIVRHTRIRHSGFCTTFSIYLLDPLEPSAHGGKSLRDVQRFDRTVQFQRIYSCAMRD